ncbi:hypothetical protein OUZ56_019612 [Daphnia magna]|uniref:Uncharacterized protein n=1 Tax=Daphnia magna TaxID=35525 RepID=A0ABQ9ZC36_9CRUS|nr:hypothetical protein OUZ56_019612 [Daphnia magna]
MLLTIMQPFHNERAILATQYTRSGLSGLEVTAALNSRGNSISKHWRPPEFWRCRDTEPLYLCQTSYINSLVVDTPGDITKLSKWLKQAPIICRFNFSAITNCFSQMKESLEKGAPKKTCSGWNFLSNRYDDD